ncbi:hypothetical protein SEPCBS119000_003430 [Sporothrix epigloea]|uniref:DUF7820 domain-containing protein n=1 Tax=Sporothrix epigloea TaxID=1892477 RepID=A0ABP0DQT9_9PEZI
MDRSDENESQSQQPLSQHYSRNASTNADAEVLDAIDEGANTGTVMTVSDSFRPYTEATTEAATASNPTLDRAFSARSAAGNERSHMAGAALEEDCPVTATTAAPGLAKTSTSTSTCSLHSPTSSPALDNSSPPNSLAPTYASPRPSDAPAPAPLLISAFPEPQHTVSSAQSSSLAAVQSTSFAHPPTGQLAQSLPLDGEFASASNDACPLANVQTDASSSVPPACDKEPDQGPSGPSFSYLVYPHNSCMSRPLDVGEASTVEPMESTYDGPRRPAFPYAMYTQSTVTSPSPEPMTVPGVSVGAPGVVDNYRQHTGPHGEDVADLIGPLGHIEQLPPYTRYPNEAYNRKIAAAYAASQANTSADSPADTSLDTLVADPTVAQVTTLNGTPESVSAPQSLPAELVSTLSAATRGPAPDPPPIPAQVSTPALIDSVPGAGGIGLAPHNPEFDGVEDAQSPRSVNSLGSFHSERSRHKINPTECDINEKRKHKAADFIQRYGRRRLLGIIPYWAICLVVTVLLLMGIILGAVLGVFLANNQSTRHYSHQPSSTVSVTVTVDASPISMPSNLPSLPTGTFSLPFAINESPSSCFNDTTQSQAWECTIADQRSMSLTIASLGQSPSGPIYGMTINSNASATYKNNVFLYGEQAPSITTQTKLQMVQDTLDKDRGPAWFKMVTYNKTVIVRETYLTAPMSQPSSLSSTENNSKQRRHFDGRVAGSASKACYPGHWCGYAAHVGDKPWVCTWPDTILEIFIYPNQNSSACGGSASMSGMTASSIPISTSASLLVAPNGAAKSLVTTSSTAPFPAFTQMLNLPPPYPRVVKMEERRMDNSPEATCVQYKLTLVGNEIKAVPNLDASGHPIQLNIAEIEPDPTFCPKGKRDQSGAGEIFKKRDEDDLSKCGCLWMAT